MQAHEDILARLPGDDGDEPKNLRREILDELSDHLTCAMEEELNRGTEESSARQNVLSRFGNPQLVALELWRIAMADKIARERFIIGAVSLLLLIQFIFIATFFVWVVPNLGAAEAIHEDNEKILAALEDLKNNKITQQTAQSANSSIASQSEPDWYAKGALKEDGHQGLRRQLGEDRIIAELPFTKDCMVLKYLPDWAYGNVDNIAFANNDGGVRIYFDWEDIPEDYIANDDYRFYAAFYSRKATLGENPGDVLIFPATADWPETTSWNTQPTVGEVPRFRLPFRPAEGWKLYNISDIVRSPENQYGACLRFEHEDVQGPSWSGHAFVATEAQPQWKGFEPVLLILNEPVENPATAVEVENEEN